jgi:hypothetical protein
MHCIVPFAGPPSGAGAAALGGLALPTLQQLLKRWTVVARDDGDEWSYSPPHERALARAWGWAGGDGQLPFAAAWLAQEPAAANAAPPGDLAWGLLSPVHWHVGTDQVSLLDPAALMLSDTESRAYFDAVAELFTSEGCVLHWGSRERWYLAHEKLAGLRCASLDRVVGRNVDRWLGGDGSAPDAASQAAQRWLRRLQGEVQMLLYTHPLNDARAERGLLPVNSFWLSGCGVAQPQAQNQALHLDNRLRGPALADDLAGWVRAWTTLDEGPLAELLQRADPADRLTLCGERSALTLAPATGWWAGLRGRLSAPTPARLLEGL